VIKHQHCRPFGSLARLTNSSGSARAGVPAKGAIGVTLTENINNHIRGEIHSLLHWGGPQLRFDGTQTNLNGHTNAVTYDFLFYMVPHESAIRPFVSGSAGIKVHPGNGQQFLDTSEPLANFALLRPITQVEPAISVGVGVKFTFANHAQVRIELRTYMTPLQDLVFRPTGLSKIRGWLYDFVPLGGISYVL
jgi:hypothetical protein